VRVTRYGGYDSTYRDLFRYIIRLLVLRGETKIRVLDLHPPHPDILSNPSISYIKTDITSIQSVRESLTQPFGASGPPTVIYHTAALIRFWERASYAWGASHSVNVQGTANVLSVAKKLPNAILIYTSSSDTCIPCAKFLRLGLDYKMPPYHKITISDDDPPLPPSQSSESCYTRSKVLAERLVIGASGWNGFKTGIIRPGR
jgi:nucleoside-diphosphate-sugar epimerase